MIRFWGHLALYFVVICFLTGHDQVLSQQPQPPTLKLRTSSDQVSPLETVELIELVSRSDSIEVLGIDHHVVRIGRYDNDTKSITQDDISEFVRRNSEGVFSSLPQSTGFSHPFQFDVTTSSGNGTKYVIRPKKLGVFLIRTTWHLKQDKLIQSNPVVLTVVPPLDKTGQPIVRREWLDPLDR